MALGLDPGRDFGDVTTTHLPAEEQRRFELHRLAVIAYLKGHSVRKWLKDAETSYKQFLKMVRRALPIDPTTGKRVGWLAFLAGATRKPYVREQSTLCTNGYAGALTQCLNTHESVREALIDLLIGPETAPRPMVINKIELHVEFLRLLQAAGVTQEEWPFCTRFEGRRSLDKWIDERLLDHYERGIDIRYGEAAASRLLTGRGFKRHFKATHPYDIAEMDGHRFHVMGSVGITTPEGIVVYVPIERLQLILIADGFGHIAGYTVAIRREACSIDLLAAWDSATAPWAPREFQYASLAYEDGAGLPSGAVEGLDYCGFGLLFVDRALINFSSVIIDQIVPRLGCSINWGPVRKWMRRALVEAIFSQLEKRGLRRLKSNVGSHPTDPIRRQAEKAAVECRITWQLLIDIIELEITRFNQLGGEGSYGVGRLERLRQFATDPALNFLVPKLPLPNHARPNFDVWMSVDYVRGRKRRPYTQLYRARYTSESLAKRSDLIGKRIRRHCHWKNGRTIHAFDLTGKDLGELVAKQGWGDFDHTIDMRLQTMRLVDDGRIKKQHPKCMVMETVNELHQEALADARKNRVSKAATALAREAEQTRSSERGVVKQPGPRPAPAQNPSKQLQVRRVNRSARAFR